eukprot:Gb_37544 [translate_table: standard]
MSRKRTADCMLTEEESKKLEMKFATLKEDYQELQRENRALKKRVQRARLKKNNLFEEVRFLRRRYKVLTQQDSEEPACQLVIHESGSGIRSMGRGFKSLTEAVPLEDESATFEGNGLEPFSASDDCHTSENTGRQPLTARAMPVFSAPQRSSVTSAVKPANAKSKGLVSSLTPAKVKYNQNRGIKDVKDSQKKWTATIKTG